MSETTASLQRKLASAGDLHSVVRTMKSIAASRVAQYQESVRALGDYHRSVELALSASLYPQGLAKLAPVELSPNRARPHSNGTVSAVVFGSDQGLVGQFNQSLARYTEQTLSPLPGRRSIWAVGERVAGRLEAAGLPVAGMFPVPASVKAIVPLVARVQLESGMPLADQDASSFFVIHHRPSSAGSYEPVSRRLLPLDARWQRSFEDIRWPEARWPEVMPAGPATLRALIGELLFISIFRACAESLASENASRLAAMTRAERNIDELSRSLRATYHQLRQAGIDEELFDLVSGYDALTAEHAASALAAPHKCTGSRGVSR